MAIFLKTKILFLLLLAVAFARIVSESLSDPQSSKELQWNPIQSNFHPFESDLEGDLEADSLMSTEPPYDEDDWSKQRALAWHGWPGWRPSNERVEEERMLKDMEGRKHREATEQLQKDNEQKRARATKELAWFVVTALLPLFVIFIFKLRSAAISRCNRREKIHHNPAIY